jgi:hypothetical protein
MRWWHRPDRELAMARAALDRMMSTTTDPKGGPMSPETDHMTCHLPARRG